MSHPKKPALDVSVITDATRDFWGKDCDDLMTNVSISNNVASGTLKNVADYTSAGFDMSQGTNFIALGITPTTEGSTITCDFNGKTVTLDEDLAIVIQMTEAKKALHAVFTETVDGATVSTYTLAFSGLTLASE